LGFGFVKSRTATETPSDHEKSRRILGDLRRLDDGPESTIHAPTCVLLRGRSDETVDVSPGKPAVNVKQLLRLFIIRRLL